MMMQKDSRFIFDAPWIIIPPSILLSVLILCFNQAGDKLTGDKHGAALSRPHAQTFGLPVILF